jgi:hypothetical protein
MAWIRLIKTADTVDKEIDDFTGVFADEHVFSDLELEQFTIKKIEGFDREDIVAWLTSNSPQKQRIYRTSATANVWSITQPEKKTAWDDNGTWRFLEKDPKFNWSFSNFTPGDFDLLADVNETNPTKAALFLSKIRFKLTELSENQVEVIF